jgi:hypothetical protein
MLLCTHCGYLSCNAYLDNLSVGTWAGHELSVEDNCVVVTTKERTVKIPYSQAKSPAEVCCMALLYVFCAATTCFNAALAVWHTAATAAAAAAREDPLRPGQVTSRGIACCMLVVQQPTFSMHTAAAAAVASAREELVQPGQVTNRDVHPLQQDEGVQLL